MKREKTISQTSSISAIPFFLACALALFSNSQATGQLDISSMSYAQRGDSALFLDWYAPSLGKSSNQNPLIIFAHGGGFSRGSRLDTKNQSFCASLANAGFSVASLDYRLRQVGYGFHCDVPIDDKREAILWAAEDMIAAVDFLTKNNTNPVILIGSSAGAEAALFAAYHIGHPAVVGVVTFAGAMEWNPSFIHAPALLAFHGTCDQLVPFGRAIHHYCDPSDPGGIELMGGGALAHCLPNIGASVRLIQYDGQGHECASRLLMDKDAQSEVILFARKVHSGFEDFITVVIPTENPCPIHIECTCP